jgi:hypothetical protein
VLRLASKARIRLLGRREPISDPDALLCGGARVVDHDAVDPRWSRCREERHVLVAEQAGFLTYPGGFFWESGPPSEKSEPSGVDGPAVSAGFPKARIAALLESPNATPL